ncbi:HD domain-containing protein [candidate division KSB1 bacterium]|nr:HD domain-containing protein [candidate division KSB1 bacterium]
MDLKGCNKILEKGYPNRDDLAKFPLGDKLRELDLLAWTKTARTIKLKEDELDLGRTELEEKLKADKRMLEEEQLGEIYRKHISRVISCINHLVEPDFKGFIERVPETIWANDPLSSYIKFIDSLKKEEDTRKFLRFVALYHDIGKVTHRDRHPILGRHILESLSDRDTNDFKNILGKRFSMMIQLIAYHDLFGVLCTGEASRPVLIDALRHKEAEKSISCLVTLNLADIAGTLPEMRMEIMHTVLSDWLFMKNLLEEQRPEHGIIYRSALEKQILSQAQEQERTTERIRRLLVTIIFRVNNNADLKETLIKSVTSDLVLDALKTRLGPELLVFCYDFALVCKLDYLLRFFIDLISKWIELKIEEKPDNGDIDIREIIFIILEILVRLVTNYRDLTHQREGWPRRIGLELLGITRAKDISQRVIDLLLKGRHIEGVNWIADEATAWYFI